ncbi:ABC transporter permease [Primorskyibacter sp. 2E233]|uniref:ABC transporter permease n=1 Tax=Primorskyibacter sp. 2E233 TaxID=3413431 RepID=UPI003BF047D5
MIDLWDGLSPQTQDLLFLVGLLALQVVLACIILWGLSPLPLVRALFRRFRGTAVLFVLLIAVSVGVGIGLIAQERALRHASAQAADPFDLIVAARGSEITALMASVFLQPSDIPLLDGATFGWIAGHEAVEFAAPLGFGDSIDGAPVVGTISDLVSHLTKGAIDGRMWQTSQEALIGSAAPYAIGAELEPAHGTGPEVDHDAHEGSHFTVVGRLPHTGTPWDRAIVIPIEGLWEMHGLANGHSLDHGGQLGAPFELALFPGTPAIVVRPKSLAGSYGLRSAFNQGEGTMAFFPGTVLARLYGLMGDVRQAMSLLALVSQGLLAISVLISLFILTRLFQRHLAVLRALGAPGRFVFGVIWSFATLLLGFGAALGLGVGLCAASVLSHIVTAQTDMTVSASLGWSELHLVAGFMTLASLAALVPAISVLQQSVEKALRG